MDYSLVRICKSCGHEDSKALHKMDAVFEERRNVNVFWNSKCTQCNSSDCASLQFPMVPFIPLDREILDEWGHHLELSLLDQDEEIILAELDHLTLILTAIDENNYLPTKIETLIESVCVLLYDNSYISDEFDSEMQAERQEAVKLILPELIKRKTRVIQIHLADYIKKVVFPLLNL